jgi:hypothetical protein
VVVEFDGSQQDQNVISRTTNVRAVDGQITQMKATQKIDDEADAMSKMSSEYDLERAKLDASKARSSRDRRREEPDHGGCIRRRVADGEGLH